LQSTHAQPAGRRALFDFAPDEVCRFPASMKAAGIFPIPLLIPRWALTPPFHPYLTAKNTKENNQN